MNKSDLVNILVEQKKNLNHKDAELIVNTIFDAMTETLASGDRIELRGFGSFFIKERRAREARNPKTGEAVSVDAKRVPFFKPGKELRESVDQK